MRKRGDVFDIPNADFTQVLSSNVVGTWCMMRSAMPYLQKSSNGCIINISSCAGVDPGSESSAIAYSVSKAAINHLTKLTAKYSGPTVRVNAIAPGLILTSRTKNFDEAIDKFKDRTPLKRVGEPNDIAELILGMVKSRYINGEVVLADGGFSTV